MEWNDGDRNTNKQCLPLHPYQYLTLKPHVMETDLLLTGRLTTNSLAPQPEVKNTVYFSFFEREWELIQERGGGGGTPRKFEGGIYDQTLIIPTLFMTGPII